METAGSSLTIATTTATKTKSDKGAGHDRVPTVDTTESTCERYTSCRWVLAYMGSLMTLLVMCLRNCISMAIVCISNIRYVGPETGMNSTRGVFNDSLEGQQNAGVFSGDAGNGSVPTDVDGIGVMVRRLTVWYGVLRDGVVLALVVIVVVVVCCLLYTSPSPRDCIVSRMPSSA